MTVNMNVDEVFRAALAAHQAGNLGQAAQAYGQILSSDRKHFDALHFGLVNSNVGLKRNVRI